jgi:hypothetical protein
VMAEDPQRYSNRRRGASRTYQGWEYISYTP